MQAKNKKITDLLEVSILCIEDILVIAEVSLDM